MPAGRQAGSQVNQEAQQHRPHLQLPLSQAFLVQPLHRRHLLQRQRGAVHL